MVTLVVDHWTLKQNSVPLHSKCMLCKDGNIFFLTISVSTTVHVKIYMIDLLFIKTLSVPNLWNSMVQVLKKLHLFEKSPVLRAIMTAYPIWRVLSSKTPYNTKSEYILRVVGPSRNQPTMATKSRWTTISSAKACLNQTALYHFSCNGALYKQEWLHLSYFVWDLQVYFHLHTYNQTQENTHYPTGNSMWPSTLSFAIDD